MMMMMVTTTWLVGVVDSWDPTIAYSQARLVRTTQGHQAAVPWYQAILQQNPSDRTAATRIAASIHTPQRQQQLPYRSDATDRRAFLQLLRDSNYTTHAIHTLVFGAERAASIFGVSPLYLTPLTAGTNCPPLPTCRLSCWIQLLLLSVCVPRSTMLTFFTHEQLQLIQRIGIGFFDDNNDGDNGDDGDGDLLIPYVHVLPIDLPMDNSTTTKNKNDNDNDNNNSIIQTYNIYVVTDLHPRVLNSIHVGPSCTESQQSQQQAVMYVGPDTIALVQQFGMHYSDNVLNTTTIPSQQEQEQEHIVDLCTGCGIQALVVAAVLRITAANPSTIEGSDSSIPSSPPPPPPRTSTTTKITCVDRNPRALAFTHCNFQWNDMAIPTLVMGDLQSPYGQVMTLDDLKSQQQQQPKQQQQPSLEDLWIHRLNHATLILANPPFLPVPSTHPIVARGARHGWFSDGGQSGEDVLKSIVTLASHVLARDHHHRHHRHRHHHHGQLAMVSEIMNPHLACQRMEQWWSSSSSVSSVSVSARGVVYTNQYPISSRTYAERRAGTSSEEVEIWKRHLAEWNITEISPGLIIIMMDRYDPPPANRSSFSSSVVTTKGDLRRELPMGLAIEHVIVPKTWQGSIWTPTNRNAVEFIQHHQQQWRQQ